MCIVPRVGIFNSFGDRHGQTNIEYGVGCSMHAWRFRWGISWSSIIDACVLCSWSVMIAPDSVFVRLIDYRIIIVSEWYGAVVRIELWLAMNIYPRTNPTTQSTPDSLQNQSRDHNGIASDLSPGRSARHPDQHTFGEFLIGKREGERK